MNKLSSFRNFASDNVAGASPEIVEALISCNSGSEHSYGFDGLTERLTMRLCTLFEKDVAVAPVVTGTAANAIALSVLTPPFRSIICSEDAHINIHECGAPEFYTGGSKLLGVRTHLGKLDHTLLEQIFERTRSDGFQAAQPRTVSISQATEWGAVYTATEIGSIAETAARYGARVHMDGARFANAIARSGSTPAELTWKAGVSALSLGATKNGAIAAEMVVLFDEQQKEALLAQQKRSGHLWSKSRFISAQLLAYFENDLWLRNAAHANQMAQRLAEGIWSLQSFRLVSLPEANEVFVSMPEWHADELRSAGFSFSDWTRTSKADQRIIRFVTSFSTSTEAVDELIAHCRDIATEFSLKCRCG